MTKKDYELITKVLRNNDPVNPNNKTSNLSSRAFYTIIVANFEDALQKDNLKFDRDKFHKAVYKV